MQVEHLTITGRIPSKKNSRNVFVRGGKQFNLPSKKYKEWHTQATIQLGSLPKIRFKEPVDMQLIFYMPDNRKCDLTNKAESVMDLLVDMGILPDDCWQCVPSLYLMCFGINRQDPRVEIWIQNKGEENEKVSLRNTKIQK